VGRENRSSDGSTKLYLNVHLHVPNERCRRGARTLQDADKTWTVSLIVSVRLRLIPLSSDC